MGHQPHSIFVVDDDEAVRSSLGLLLISRGYAVQVFDSGEAFLDAIDAQSSGCVILDLRMGGMSGLQVFDELRTRGSPLVVVFLSAHGDIPSAISAVQSGAFTWLEKPCADDKLLNGVEHALERATELAVERRRRNEARIRWERLTPREKEVARHVAQGKANKVIARDIVPAMEPRTVETHRAHIFAKLDLPNSNELDRFIRDNGL
jgi:FixJ family two-component response regulator